MEQTGCMYRAARAVYPGRGYWQENMFSVFRWLPYGIGGGRRGIAATSHTAACINPWLPLDAAWRVVVVAPTQVWLKWLLCQGRKRIQIPAMQYCFFIYRKSAKVYTCKQRDDRMCPLRHLIGFLFRRITFLADSIDHLLGANRDTGRKTEISITIIWRKCFRVSITLYHLLGC